MKKFRNFVLALAAIALMSLSLTACHDGDDYTNSITVNGKKLSVTKVERITETYTDLQGNQGSLEVFRIFDGDLTIAYIYVPTQYLNKELNLTKNWCIDGDVPTLIALLDPENLSSGYEFIAGDNKEILNNFKSGKMKITVKNDNVNISAKGVGLEIPPSKISSSEMPDMSDWNKIPFNVSYSGQYLVPDLEK